VQNENGEEAPNNAAGRGDVEAAPQGPQNDIPRQPEEVPVQQGPEINIPEGQNENVDQETAPQLEGATDPEDEMVLDGTFRPSVHRTAPPVGPTLVMLGNAGRNAARRPPRHYTVVRNNRSTHGSIEQSNIPRRCSANNGGLAYTEEAEGSSRGNRRASQSNPSVLPFFDTHTPGGIFMYSTIDYASRTASERRQQSFSETDETDCSNQCGRYEYCRTAELILRGRR
jgi:hypothetical protein